MRRREALWSDHRHGRLQGSASSPRPPVLLQSAACDVISEGEELTHSAVGRHDASLLSLRRQRRLLTLAREFVAHQLRVLEYYKTVEYYGTVERTPLLSGLEAACLGLQELCHGGASLQRRVRTNQLLRPLSPPLHRALGNMHRALQLMSVKAAMMAEELVLSAVRGASQRSAEIPGGLCRALTAYNRVIADVAPGAPPWTDLRPMSVPRLLEIMAEERGWGLAGLLSQAGLLAGEAESQEVGGAVSSRVETLLREDQCQAAALLNELTGLEGRSLCGLEGRGLDSLLYGQYCSRLGPVLCAHLLQALYPGRRGVRAVPALTPCAGGGGRAIRVLLSLLTSDAVPEQWREPGRHLGHHLLCTAAFISWDRGMCEALSSALTDKCVTPALDDGAPRRTHSRTAAALVTVCQEMLAVLRTVTSGDVISHHGVLSRCVASLQLCELWLRSRSQMYTSSGAVSHLLLISHGDLPVIKEQLRSVTSAVHNVEWPPVSQRLRGMLQNVAQSLEGVALSLPRLLGVVCTNQAQDIFQHMMPAGRHWRGKMANGPDLVPSGYAQAAVGAVLVPLLEGVGALALEEQLSAVSLTIGGFMEAWMGQILRERPRFSLQGALQLRCDFESVRDLLRSRDWGLSPEVVQTALSLPVFQQADTAIVCLLQQPSRKAYLQSRGCSVFCCPPLCRTAVESVSDSLQSLDSLGRQVWSHPAHRPRHSHDSYLPHNQRQWLSLRLHKS